MHIIGISIDGRASLSPANTNLILSADLIFGGKRLLELFTDAQGEKHPIGADLRKIVDTIRANPGKRAVVLGSGDPNFFGIADFILRNFPKNEVEIIPAVSSMQWAFAKARIPWSHAAVVSLHGKGEGRDLDALFEALERTDTVGIFTDPAHTPAVIAGALKERGYADCRMVVCEDLGEASERVSEGTPGEMGERGFSPMNVVIVQRGNVGAPLAAPSQGPLTGLPDSSYAHKNGMITKAEVRAVSLAKLALTPDSMLWDIGAGSGSLSIEAASLMPRGRVYAVEKDAEMQEFIRRNMVQFGSRNVELVQGEAPDALLELPAPDRVFIGGSGGSIRAILSAVHKALRPGGRIVINSVLLETMTEAVAFFKESGYSLEVCTVNIAKTGDLAGRLIFRAENPVFLITAFKT